MSSLSAYSPTTAATKFDGNVIKWSGFFTTSKQAEEHLKEQTHRILETRDKLVVKAKADFINRHFKGYFLYKFTIVLADRD